MINSHEEIKNGPLLGPISLKNGRLDLFLTQKIVWLIPIQETERSRAKLKATKAKQSRALVWLAELTLIVPEVRFCGMVMF